MKIDPENNSIISCIAHGEQGIHIKYLKSQVLESFSIIILQEGDYVANFIGRTRPYISSDQLKSFYLNNTKTSNSSCWNSIEWTMVEGRLVGTAGNDSGPINASEFIIAGDFEYISIAIIGKPVKFADGIGQKICTSIYRGLLAADILHLNTKNPTLDSIEQTKNEFMSFCKSFPVNRTKNLNFLDMIMDIISTNTSIDIKSPIKPLNEMINHMGKIIAYKTLSNYLVECRRTFICKECIFFNQSYAGNCKRAYFVKYNNCYANNCLYATKLYIWHEIINQLQPDDITDLEILTLLAIHKPLASFIYGKLIKTFHDGNNTKSLKLISWLNPIARILSYQGLKFKWKFLSDSNLTYLTNWKIIENNTLDDVYKLSKLKKLKDFVLNVGFRDKILKIIDRAIEELITCFEKSITDYMYWSKLVIVCTIAYILKLTELESSFDKLRFTVSKIEIECPSHNTKQCFHINYHGNNILTGTYKLIAFAVHLIENILFHLTNWQKILDVALFSRTNPSELVCHLYNDARHLRYELCNLTGILLPVKQIMSANNAFKHGPNNIVNYFAQNDTKISHIGELKSFIWGTHKYEIAEEIMALSEGKSVESILSQLELKMLNSTNKLSVESQRNCYLFQAYHLLLSRPEDNYEDLLNSEMLSRFLVDGSFSNNPTSLVISSRICKMLGMDGDNRLGVCWLDDLEQGMEDHDLNSLVRLLIFGKYAMNDKFAISPMLINTIKNLLSYVTGKGDITLCKLVIDLIASIFYNLEDHLINGEILRPLIDSFCQFINYLTTMNNNDYNNVIMDALETLSMLRSKKLTIVSLLFQIPEMFLNHLIENEYTDATIPVSAWGMLCLKNVFTYAIKLLSHNINIGYLIAHKLLVICLMIKECCYNQQYKLYEHFINLMIYGINNDLSFDAEIEDTQILAELIQLMKNFDYADTNLCSFQLRKELILYDIERASELVSENDPKGIPLRIPMDIFKMDCDRNIVNECLKMYENENIASAVDGIWADFLAILLSNEWNVLTKSFQIELDGNMLRYYESANAADTASAKSRKKTKNIDIFRQRKNISSRAPSKHVDDFEFAVKLASARNDVTSTAKSLKMEANEWKNFVHDCKAMKIKIEKIIQNPDMLKNDEIKVTLTALLEKHTGVANALQLMGVNLSN